MFAKFTHFFHAMPAHSPGYFVKLIGGIVFVLLFLGALQLAPRLWRKKIIGIFTFLGGIYYPLEFFWPSKPHPAGSPSANFLTPYQDFVTTVSTVIGSFAIGLGVISLIQLHARNVSRQRGSWGNSVALIVSFVAMTVFGLLNAYKPTGVVIPAVPHGWSPITNKNMFNFLFKGGFVSIGSAVFALIAFYIASASYRAFRIRSLESTLLMISALIVMLASVTFGTALTSHLPNGDSPWANFRIEHIAEWLLTKINAPAQRGITFGLTIGGLAISLRLWLSLERGAYFDAEV